MAKKSALVLFSGGQDSTVSLLWACQNFDHIETVGFNYNQRHIVEMKCRNIILKNIDYWKEAPVWTPETIKKETTDWFKYLGNE